MSPGTDICRLCGGPASGQFSRLVLGRHTVEYFKCRDCMSLQAEEPYWLESAYTNSLAALDTGAAQRNLSNLGAVTMVARMLGMRNILDFGGGDGFLCRLLRDYGFNCYLADKYAKASYAQGFTEPDFAHPDLMLAFEVFEHFARPAQDLDALFAYKPAALLATTELYDGQNETWWYLTPETGQHIFFYSPQAVRLIAERHGYRSIRSGNFLLFMRKDLPAGLREPLLGLALNRFVVRMARTFLVAGPAPGRDRDFEYLRRKSQAGGVLPLSGQDGP
jgi:Methyltransferase domain